MNAFLISLLVLAGLGISCGILIVIRNDQVYKYRNKLIDSISDANQADIRRDYRIDTSWRWDVFRKVSYEAMVYKFWRSLDSFYPDKSFLRPTANKGVKS